MHKPVDPVTDVIKAMGVAMRDGSEETPVNQIYRFRLKHPQRYLFCVQYLWYQLFDFHVPMELVDDGIGARFAAPSRAPDWELSQKGGDLGASAVIAVSVGATLAVWLLVPAVFYAKNWVKGRVVLVKKRRAAKRAAAALLKALEQGASGDETRDAILRFIDVLDQNTFAHLRPTDRSDMIAGLEAVISNFEARHPSRTQQVAELRETLELKYTASADRETLFQRFLAQDDRTIRLDLNDYKENSFLSAIVNSVMDNPVAVKILLDWDPKKYEDDECPVTVETVNYDCIHPVGLIQTVRDGAYYDVPSFIRLYYTQTESNRRALCNPKALRSAFAEECFFPQFAQLLAGDEAKEEHEGLSKALHTHHAMKDERTLPRGPDGTATLFVHFANGTVTRQGKFVSRVELRCNENHAVSVVIKSRLLRAEITDLKIFNNGRLVDNRTTTVSSLLVNGRAVVLLSFPEISANIELKPELNLTGGGDASRVSSSLRLAAAMGFALTAAASFVPR